MTWDNLFDNTLLGGVDSELGGLRKTNWSKNTHKKDSSVGKMCKRSLNCMHKTCAKHGVSNSIRYGKVVRAYSTP